MENYMTLPDGYAIGDYVDKKVKATGNISDMPWQHMIGSFDGYDAFYYFDIQDNQIVIYCKTPITCKKTFTIYGTVVEISGKSKRPGSEEVYTEYHILVERWKCGE